MDSLLRGFFNQHLSNFFLPLSQGSVELSLEDGVTFRNLRLRPDGINEQLQQNGVDLRVEDGMVGQMKIAYTALPGIVTLQMRNLDVRVQPNALKTIGRTIAKTIDNFLQPPAELPPDERYWSPYDEDDENLMFSYAPVMGSQMRKYNRSLARHALKELDLPPSGMIPPTAAAYPVPPPRAAMSASLHPLPPLPVNGSMMIPPPPHMAQQQGYYYHPGFIVPQPSAGGPATGAVRYQPWPLDNSNTLSNNRSAPIAASSSSRSASSSSSSTSSPKQNGSHLRVYNPAINHTCVECGKIKPSSQHRGRRAGSHKQNHNKHLVPPPYQQVMLSAAAAPPSTGSPLPFTSVAPPLFGGGFQVAAAGPQPPAHRLPYYIPASYGGGAAPNHFYPKQSPVVVVPQPSNKQQRHTHTSNGTHHHSHNRSKSSPNSKKNHRP